MSDRFGSTYTAARAAAGGVVMLGLGAGGFHPAPRLCVATSVHPRHAVFVQSDLFDSRLSPRQTSTLLDQILSHCKPCWSWTKPTPPSLRPIDSTSMEV